MVRARSRVAIVCGGGVILLGLLTLFEYVFAINLGIDHVLINPRCSESPRSQGAWRRTRLSLSSSLARVC